MQMRAFVMDWVPVVFVIFKAAALGLAMFFAIKWHYDQGEKGETLALVRTGGKVAAVFALAVLVLAVFAFFLSSKLGLDLNL